MTWASTRRRIGSSAAQTEPTASASVETAIGTPSQGEAIGLTVQRLMLTELIEHNHRQQAGARPAPRDRHGMAPALD